MKTILLVTADNCQDYEEHKTWNCFVSETSRDVLEERVKKLNEEIRKLHLEAKEFHEKKSKNPEYCEPIEKTAKGVRYLKFLKDNGIIPTLKGEYVSSCPIQIYIQEIPVLNF